MQSVDLEHTVERVRDVVRDVIAPAAEAIDADARWPAEGLAALLDAGLGGLVVPTEYGGLGLGAVGLLRVGEVLGSACPSTALCFGMHCVAAATIAADASPWQVDNFLKPIVAGDHLTTLALSEPGTGAHFWMPTTTLDATDGALHANGTKSFVTNGGRADSYVVSTVDADPLAPPGSFSCLVIAADAPGLRWDGEWTGMGMRGNSSRTLHLDDVTVPADALLGRVGDEIRYVFGVIAPYFLVAMSGTYLGIAQSAMNTAVDHLQHRSHVHTARTLADSPVIQHHVGRLWAIVARSRQLALHAAEGTDSGRADALPALCASKADIAEAVVEVVNESMTLAGGLAYRDGSALHRNLRDARAAHIMSPTTDLLRIWTGRVALGRPLLGEL